jgi:hypothetical protein
VFAVCAKSAGVTNAKVNASAMIVFFILATSPWSDVRFIKRSALDSKFTPPTNIVPDYATKSSRKLFRLSGEISETFRETSRLIK